MEQLSVPVSQGVQGVQGGDIPSTSRQIPSNNDTNFYIPANPPKTGFLRGKYDPVYLEGFLAEEVFSRVVDKASILIAKLYMKIKNEKAKLNKLYPILLSIAFMTILIFLVGEMWFGENAFIFWSIFLWISLLCGFIILVMVFIEKPPPEKNFQLEAKKVGDKYFNEINADPQFASRNILWSIPSNMDYIRIKLPEGRSVARQHNPTVATLQTEPAEEIDILNKGKKDSQIS